MSHRRRLARWLRRARPAWRDLARALGAGLLASLSGTGLFVGAVTLLVVAAQRPGLRAIAGFLIVIELLAFLRSPIRFAERLSTHRLGFAAVSQWRRWLTRTVGAWDYATWRAHATGDLLERSLRDTEDLQDLWLRGVVPVSGALATLVGADVVVLALAPHGSWARVAIAWAGLQVLGLGALASSYGALVEADGRVRSARAHYRATVVELSAATPALSLLGVEGIVRERSRVATAALARAETRARRRAMVPQVVAPLVGAAHLGVLAAWRPAAASTWLVVAVLLALACAEALALVREALATLIEVGAAAERLEALGSRAPAAHGSWPARASLDVVDLTVAEGERHLLTGVSLSLAPGRRVAVVGPSGSGKSALLRAVAGLDAPVAGRVRVGGVDVRDLDEAQLRRALAYVGTEPDLTRGLARDVLLLGRVARRDPFADLARLGLASEPDARWEGLSRGERERVAVVRALVTAPEIVVLDEPTAGLGPTETAAVLELLDAAGVTVLVASHDARVVAWCDEVFEVSEGSLERVSR